MEGLRLEENVLVGEAAVAFGGGLDSPFGGVALVVGAAGDDMLAGDVTVLQADDAEAEHGVGKAGTDEGEGSFGVLVGREER